DRVGVRSLAGPPPLPAPRNEHGHPGRRRFHRAGAVAACSEPARSSPQPRLSNSGHARRRGVAGSGLFPGPGESARVAPGRLHPGDSDLRLLIDATFAPSLRCLDLRVSRFSAEALRELARPEVFPNLRQLNVSRPPHEGAQVEAALKERFGEGIWISG